MSKFTVFQSTRQERRERAKRRFRGFVVATILGAVVFIGTVTTVVVRSSKFNIECGGRLERAANASNIELASQELDAALNYLERNNLTSGYTSILWNTPDEDLGFAYRNIKTANDELKSMPDTISNLEESNMLIKLRETLTDTDSGGSQLAIPDGISRYPNNLAFAIALWVSFLTVLIGIPSMIVISDDL